MIFPVVLVLTLTLTNGHQVSYPLAHAVSDEHCQALGDTYVALGGVLPKTVVSKATLSCEPAEGAEEEAAPTNYETKWQKVPGAAI